MRKKIPEMLYGGSLLTLSFVGVGVVHFLTGKDLGGGLQPAWLFLALAILLLISRVFVNADFESGQPWWRDIPLSLFVIISGSLLVVIISVWGLKVAPSMEPASSALWRWGRQIIQLLIMFFFLGWVAVWTRGKGRWRFTLDLLFCGLIFQVFYGLFQEINFFHPQGWFAPLEHLFTSNPSILSGSEKLYINNSLQEIPRLRGTMCEPLYLGNFLLMVWPFLLVWRRPVILRWVLGAALALLLLLTWSRGAWLGAAGQLVILVLLKLRSKVLTQQNENGLQWPSRSIILATVVLLPAGLVLVNWLAGGFLSQRLMASFNNQDWSNLTRLYSMKAAWLAFLESPVVGTGWGQFAFHFPLLVEPMGLQSQFSWPVVNNFPLQILSETGLIGALFFLGVTVYLLRKSWLLAGFKSEGQLTNPMILPAAVSVGGVWIQLMTFSQYNLPHIWVGLGLLLAAIYDSHLENTFPDKANK